MSTDSRGLSMRGGSRACKNTMFWNWDTIDACFITSSWQITSREKFAACCIGVVCLGVFLELLGRVGNMYNKHILRQFQYAPLPSSDGQEKVFVAKTSANPPVSQVTNDAVFADAKPTNLFQPQGLYLATGGQFRPSMVQQGIRAGIHTLRFGTAYLIMLLAMTLNGFLILTILAGAYVGSFMFDWETIATGDSGEITGCLG